MRFRTWHSGCLAVVSLAGACVHAGTSSAPPSGLASASLSSRVDWASYGRDALGSRFSPLTQVDTTTVKQLAVAWTYHTGEATTRTGNHRSLEVTPIVVDGTMYIITPLARSPQLRALAAYVARARQWNSSAIAWSSAGSKT
jgi:glucose dehydrogenase